MSDRCKFVFVPKGFEDETGPNDAVINTFNTNFVEALTRESIQNSLDAAIEPNNPDKPVFVKFSFGKISRKDFPEIFDLRAHAEGCYDKWKSKGRTKEIYGPMIEHLGLDELNTIEVTDWNTTGMSNEPNATGDRVFYVFTQSVGVDVKESESSGGSFGFGKAAFYQMSPIRSILVSSRTSSGETNFAGVARYCHHITQGKAYAGKGYYSPHNDFTPAQGDEIPEQFRLEKTGTKITILGHYENTWSQQELLENIERSVLSNFWMSIYNGKLVVNIGEHFEINKDNLGQKMKYIFGDIQSSPNKYSPYPYYEAYTHSEDEFHKRFNKNISNVGNVELFLYIPEDAIKDGVSKYRKQNMLIEQKEHHAKTGYYAVVLCRDEAGNKYLSSIENAQHTKWSDDGKTGQQKKTARMVLSEIDGFIHDSVTKSFGTSKKRVSVETGVESFMSACKDSENPFYKGTDFSSRQEPETKKQDSQKNDKAKEGMAGKVNNGTLSDEDRRKLIERGHKKKTKTKSDKEHKTAARGKREEKGVIDGKGNKYIEFHPVRWNAPGKYIDGIGHHIVTIHSDKEIDNAMIELGVCADSSNGTTVKISNVEGAAVSSNSVELNDRTGIGTKLLIDKINAGTTTLDITFEDKLCHSIILK